MLLEEKTLQF